MESYILWPTYSVRAIATDAMISTWWTQDTRSTCEDPWLTATIWRRRAAAFPPYGASPTQWKTTSAVPTCGTSPTAKAGRRTWSNPWHTGTTWRRDRWATRSAGAGAPLPILGVLYALPRLPSSSVRRGMYRLRVSDTATEQVHDDREGFRGGRSRCRPPPPVESAPSRHHV